MASAFTPAGYRDLVGALLDRGYRVVGYDEAEPAQRHLVLRHDIDMSVQAAAEIAEIEASIGVSAWYFVLLRSEMYNPWAPANHTDLMRIIQLGHDVGLHLDASLYGEEGALETAAERECATLESLLDRSVTAISFHRPVPALRGRVGGLAGRRHAYEPKFFSEMGYCSDSRGGWHRGEPLGHPAVAGGRGLQLLTHPIWWTAEGNESPVAILDRFRRDRDRVLAAALADNCEPYRDAYGTAPAPDRYGIAG